MRKINENKKVNKRLKDGKKNILDEIYTYIESNQIKLPTK